MEEVNIIIVGAGPAGLVLGLSLAQCGVKVPRPRNHFHYLEANILPTKEHHSGKGARRDSRSKRCVSRFGCGENIILSWFGKLHAKDWSW